MAEVAASPPATEAVQPARKEKKTGGGTREKKEKKVDDFQVATRGVARGGRGRGEGGDKARTCYTCGEPGHTSRDCDKGTRNGGGGGRGGRGRGPSAGSRLPPQEPQPRQQYSRGQEADFGGNYGNSRNHYNDDLRSVVDSSRQKIETLEEQVRQMALTMATMNTRESACQLCDGPGHIARNCQKFMRMSPPSAGTQEGRGRHCSLCNQQGHSEVDCLDRGRPPMHASRQQDSGRGRGTYRGRSDGPPAQSRDNYPPRGGEDREYHAPPRSVPPRGDRGAYRANNY